VPSLHLTKSRYTTGLICHKKLWLDVHERGDFVDPEPGSITDIGNRVGIMAHGIFPGGVLVDAAPYEHEKGVNHTYTLMEDPDVPAIFEAALEHDNIRVRVDALERLGRDRWGIREVKSSTSFKPEYIDDVACQLYVARGAGLDVRSVELVHVDNSYEKGPDGIDCETFFTRADVMGAVAEALETVEKNAAEFRKILNQPAHPEVAPWKHCPSWCDHSDRCKAGKPRDWIYHLPRLSDDQYEELTGLGIDAIRDIPEDFRLTGNQVRIRDVHANGEEYVSPDLWKALENMGLPADYLDFETMNPCIPLYEGTRPFQRIPFQWSLHRLDANGNLEHLEFLADGATDPRREFSESLIEALSGSEAPIIVYSNFEHSVISDMKELFPDLKHDLDSIIDRLADLLPVTRGYIYHPSFLGSFSLKAVAPALSENIRYENLGEVREGGEASTAFWRIAAGVLEPGENDRQIRQDLLDYCALDTLATLEIHKGLRARAKK